MELIFIVVMGAIIGAVARYALPHRETHGSALLPLLGTAVSAVLWVALTWAGLKWNGGWIWLATLVGTAVIAFVFTRLLAQSRVHADSQLLERYMKHGVPA
ncbi:MAG TPA: hypothetical protein VFU07_00595 [Candidatus Lumbricidophila sp.]|nr:hypothetical protein [Candidatus Lumbricidophila sp.]